MDDYHRYDGYGGGGYKRGRSPPRDGPHGYDDRGRHGHGRSPQRRRFEYDDDRGGHHRGHRGGGGRDDRRHRGGRGRDDGEHGEPLSYREFTIRHLPDNVTPAEAERRYEEYKETHAEHFRKKDFAERKNDPKLREAHDPRALEAPMRARSEAAVEAAKEFHAAVAEKGVDAVVGATQNDGDVQEGEGAEGEAGEPGGIRTEDGDALDKRDARGRFPVPPLAWTPTRLARDLRQCCRLVRALDVEKGLSVEENPLLAAEEEEEDVRAVLDAKDPTPELPDTNQRGEGGGRRGRKSGGRETAGAAGDDGANAEDGATEAAEDDAKVDADAAPADVDGDGTGGVAPEAIAAAVDARVTYLWRVHGVDYYAGAELTPAEYLAAPPAAREGLDAGCLMRRAKPVGGPEALEAVNQAAPEEATDDRPAGEGDDDKEGAFGKKKKRERRDPGAQWASRVDRWCRDRLTRGDPAEARLGRARVQRELDAWMQECVVKHDENRYGCTLSQKMFIAVEYVMKHIKTKQAAAVEAQREKIYDRIYMENYLAAAKAEDAEARKAKGRAGGGGRGGEDGRSEGRRGAERGGARDRDRRGGRGGRGPILGAVMQPAPGMMMVPVPGAGPLGPFVQVPMTGSEVGGPGGADGGTPGGGANVTSPNQPLVMMAAPSSGRGKSYTDLDAPSANRVVLDYGDI